MTEPPPFRINRGTALSWIAALENTVWQFDESQLSYLGKDGVTFGCSEGILARIAEPDPPFAWDGCSHLYDGQQFYLSDGMKKRLKVKGTIPEYLSFALAITGVKEMLAYFNQIEQPTSGTPIQKGD
jgi:hypothetical protein